MHNITKTLSSLLSHMSPDQARLVANNGPLAMLDRDATAKLSILGLHVTITDDDENVMTAGAVRTAIRNHADKTEHFEATAGVKEDPKNPHGTPDDFEITITNKGYRDLLDGMTASTGLVVAQQTFRNAADVALESIKNPVKKLAFGTLIIAIDTAFEKTIALVIGEVEYVDNAIQEQEIAYKKSQAAKNDPVQPLGKTGFVVDEPQA